MSDIKDLTLAEKGEARINWALKEMPVLQGLVQRFENNQPLKGIRLSGCLHIVRVTLSAPRMMLPQR
jgi:adenosylhomocysteinase